MRVKNTVGRKIALWTLKTLVLVLLLLLAVIIAWPVFFVGSFSPSPLNLWNEQPLKERLSAISVMGTDEIARDVAVEARFKFRNLAWAKSGRETGPISKAEGSSFYVWDGAKWEPVFIKGVNIGAALPGRWFTEFPEDEETYLDWLEKIGRMNANCVRVYTLLPPAFYRALFYYNLMHPEAPLWLFQELWPEEHPPGENYLDPGYTEGYFKEIRWGVDAIHGRARIPERRGRAWGVYDTDVSRYLMGYLVGRELEPEEVISTNKKNPGFSFKGQYLAATPEASPSEAWLAMSCDFAVAYEEKEYGVQHPVGIVSWPTLDPIEHDSEWNEWGRKELEFNDKVSININNMSTSGKLKAGFFGAYHIYPNYPDFMNNEEKYDLYRDEEGRLRYGGYLREFMDVHRKYPALVAEFGLATGMGTAHHSPDGYHHGGLSEEEQGRGIVRMMKAIKREGYAGGIVFEWLDEWAKKTWTTEPFMIPYERHVLWHNVIDPEQNYGLYAMETKGPKDFEATTKAGGIIRELRVAYDGSFLYLDIDLNRDFRFGEHKLLIGLDTYDRKRGEFRFAPGIEVKAPTGLEFVIEISPEKKARILVNPGYNTAQGKFSSKTSFEGEFQEMRPLINKERVTRQGKRIPARYEDASALRYGSFASNSHNHWYWEGNRLKIRIPWGRINVTDPSSLRVLDDQRSFSTLERDQLRTIRTDGIAVHALLYDPEHRKVLDVLSTKEPYAWKGWEKPDYQARLKKSYYIVARFFDNVDR